MRTKEFLRKIAQANKKAEQIQREAGIAFLRSLNEAREVYEQAMLLALAEKVKHDLKQQRPLHREAPK